MSLVLGVLVGVVSWPAGAVASESKTTPRADSGFCERGMERGRRYPKPWTGRRLEVG